MKREDLAAGMRVYVRANGRRFYKGIVERVMRKRARVHFELRDGRHRVRDFGFDLVYPPALVTREQLRAIEGQGKKGLEALGLKLA